MVESEEEAVTRTVWLEVKDGSGLTQKRVQVENSSRLQGGAQWVFGCLPREGENRTRVCQCA